MDGVTKWICSYLSLIMPELKKELESQLFAFVESIVVNGNGSLCMSHAAISFMAISPKVRVSSCRGSRIRRFRTLGSVFFIYGNDFPLHKESIGPYPERACFFVF